MFDDLFDSINWDILEQNDLPGRDDILTVAQLLEVDQGSVLGKIRVVLEKFVDFLLNKYSEETSGEQSPRKQKPMAEKIRFLKTKGECSEYIADQCMFLWKVGSIGSHDLVNTKHGVLGAVQTFVELVEWFVDEKLGGNVGSTEHPRNQRLITDNFTGPVLSGYWEPFNKPDQIIPKDGTLNMQVGWFSDWWVGQCQAPYVILRGVDYVPHEFVAELRYAPGAEDWPFNLHAGLVLMEQRPDWYPNNSNVLFWGVKSAKGGNQFALEELRQERKGLFGCQGLRPSRWLPNSASFPRTIRVRQVLSDAGWTLKFEVAGNDGEEPPYKYETGPYERGHYVGLFAKNFNMFTTEFHVRFQAFQLEIT
ncbi:MAG TPA: hypothetical protein VKK79_03730 [Candidatus Lokiarchaeia archaeon]|nr:hypothetical protein [Candidatus Lokiarchaeia archaeon]